MVTFKKCPWTPEEDMRLVTHISRYGTWNWSQMPAFAGLSRSGKSCRLRWLNYLDPQVKRGNYTQEEDEIIINMRSTGVGWSAIALRLPGRTDNEIKNRWHSKLKKQIPIDNMAVETVAPIIEAKIDADLIPEAPDLEVYKDCPISSDIQDLNVYLNDKVSPTWEIGADALSSFWREPFSFENIYDIDEYAAYVDPEIGMYPENWFGVPYNSYYGVV